MRLFNPVTKTEVLPGFHDTTGATALPSSHWFFTLQEIPEGKRLAVDDNGEPVLESWTDAATE
ncbi:hypothetical protein [Cronobacter dublinensis]|uniref:hypothetical protein n=1 Tax=Cronobacter dublinensis TaxID=413497 RepID=UPI00300DDADC